MMRQIEAEEMMQDEVELDNADENVLAEVEDLYRAATSKVKTLSVKLVLADKAFGLVRNRMQNLVETIESLLVQYENDDDYVHGDSNTHSTVQSDEDGNNSVSSQKSHDRRRLVERAKRAELSAEVAVREAMLAKQEAEKIKSDKQREINELKVSLLFYVLMYDFIAISYSFLFVIGSLQQKKLAEMETKSQILASEHQQSYLNRSQARSSHFLDEAKSFLESTIDNDPGDKERKHRLKQQFRSRIKR
jgi:hypothetical protein